MKRRCNRAKGGGFTLIELAVVLAMIALVLAIALPQFAPLLVFSRHEGAARHLAAYGREVMTYCALGQQRLSVQIDLDAQELWCLQWPEPPIEDLLTEDQADFLSSMTADTQLLTESASDDEDIKASYESVIRFADRRERTMTRRMEQLTSNIDEGMLDEIGPLFEEDFSLDALEELEPEEVTEMLLQRVRLGEGLALTRVDVGSESFTEGLVEVDATPTGLASMVVMQLENEEGEAYTITWDPVLCEGRFEQGMLTPLDEVV
jgi:prepilin-type N-terminal cleavage/methylation domain-containing protein